MVAIINKVYSSTDADGRRSNRRRAVTLVEVMIATGLFILFMLAAYRLFFAEVKSIKTALEHIGVNESARRLFAHLGNDIRNSNWLDFPQQTNRQTVEALMPINEGQVCVLRRQIFDFSIKPPDPNFLREEIIEYFLKKAEDGTSDLYRRVKTDMPNVAQKQYERKVCDGVRDILIYTTNRKPVSISGAASILPTKNLYSFEPYDLDGSGPYLVHARVSLIRKGEERDPSDPPAFTVRTCFNVRGKLNGVHP
ncbi:MAG TPA: hypothetical protein DCG57_01190 [Candidatus Riflebacteria bacterium]|jgi:hypothetical protein|nr:hypothetical protein [Candidatus Riflebacteria bacterium]